MGGVLFMCTVLMILEVVLVVLEVVLQLLLLQLLLLQLLLLQLLWGSNRASIELLLTKRGGCPKTDQSVPECGGSIGAPGDVHEDRR